jgi:hypothetical protein
MNEQYDQFTTGDYIRVLPHLLASPLGLCAIALFLGLCASVVLFPKTKWIVVTLLLYLCTLGYSALATNTLAAPLQQLRAFGRSGCLALLVVLLLPTMMTGRGWRTFLVSPAAAMWLALNLFLALRVLVAGGFVRGGLGAIMHILVFVVFGLGVPRWLQSWADVRAAFLSIGAAAGLIVISTAYQLSVNRGAVIAVGRLYGVTGNAQMLGMVLATAIPAVCYIILRAGGLSSLFRPSGWIGGAVLGLAAVFLVWTGSRTGAMMAVCALLFFFRARLGMLIIPALLAGVAVYVALSVYGEGVSSGANRLLSTENTRAVVWASLLSEFRSNPLFGSAGQELDLRENTFLCTAARTGVMGLGLLLATTALVARTLIKIRRVQPGLGREGLAVDAIIAGFASMLVASIAESLMGTLTFQNFASYIYLGIATFVLDPALWAAGEAQQYQSAEGEGWDPGAVEAEPGYAMGLAPQAEAW